ncbi:tRNA pseudouridine(38-40) synthase TruA [Ignatzschineria rhizosphaerae]|uniref:tRNA pseudouridine synthase A n=1 Tax=Ignatzschineria rhizosphaerae TaxID=2923279 RepID=A0ABY3WX65_9GAMM|nr:tRNA pseudouridine(38-40) synthase TruA [Ignatzschineria rhizosphaerae]UNM95198.1 tRNA pseudouridine(38-40) synthase TruA [Ignatzschineria rhizosphaerae]
MNSDSPSYLEAKPQQLQKYALLIEYDGRQFKGWQKQNNPPVRSIEEELERAVSFIANEPIKLTCAGRTDAGVHAINQVIHFETTAIRPKRAWMLGINSNLPEDCAIKDIVPVKDDFHARFSAISRTYRYQIFNHPFRSPLKRFYALWNYHPLDIAAMEKGAQYLIGEHDFSAFRSSECQANTPFRNVHYIRFTEKEHLIEIELKANAFLHNMVRNIVGTLLEVGLGKEPPEYIKKVLESLDRTKGGITAPPQGLYLYNVEYPDGIAPEFDQFSVNFRV